MTRDRGSDDQVTYQKRGDADLVTVFGEIDLANANTVARQIIARITESGTLLIDLTPVSFLDSAGVRLLDALIGDLDNAGKTIRLIVGESGAAMMTLKLCAFRDDLLATDLERAAEELSG